MNYQPIENYGVIGDLATTALVSLNGSIDFMCFPLASHRKLKKWLEIS